jgi:hypothetical protein
MVNVYSWGRTLSGCECFSDVVVDQICWAGESRCGYARLLQICTASAEVEGQRLRLEICCLAFTASADYVVEQIMLYLGDCVQTSAT